MSDSRGLTDRTVWVTVAATLTVFIVIVGTIAVLLLRSVNLDLDFKVDCPRGRLGSVHFVDGPDPFTDTPALDAPGRWVVVDQEGLIGGIVGDEPLVGGVVLARLDAAVPERVRLADADEALLSPGGAHLSLERAGVRKIVRLADRRVVARITGETTAAVFTAPDRMIVVLSTSGCTFRRALEVDLTERTARRLQLRGIETGVAPVGVVDDGLVFNRVRTLEGYLSPLEDGVSIVDLRTGRTRRLTRYGQAVAIVQSPPRVWIADGEGLSVVDPKGLVVSRTDEPVRAAALAGGSVAYTKGNSFDACTLRSAPPNAELRIASADGPQPTDRSVAIPCVVRAGGDEIPFSSTSTLIATTEDDTILVFWQQDFDVGLLACSAHDLVCRELGRSPEYILASIRGVITTPLGRAL